MKLPLIAETFMNSLEIQNVDSILFLIKYILLDNWEDARVRRNFKMHNNCIQMNIAMYNLSVLYLPTAVINVSHNILKY